MCSIDSGQKRLDGAPAKSAADSVSQGGFPLEHQNLKGAKPPSKNGIKPFWGGGRGLGTQPAGISAGCRALAVLIFPDCNYHAGSCAKQTFSILYRDWSVLHVNTVQQKSKHLLLFKPDF